ASSPQRHGEQVAGSPLSITVEENIAVTVLLFTLVVWIGSFAAGLLGALTGLGGGVVIVPLLVLAVGVYLHYAVGASLVSVIATSAGAAAAYVREGYSNVRLAMFLELATTLGAVAGAYVAVFVPGGAVAVVFGVVLLVSAYLASQPHNGSTEEEKPDPLAQA